MELAFDLPSLPEAFFKVDFTGLQVHLEILLPNFNRSFLGINPLNLVFSNPTLLDLGFDDLRDLLTPDLFIFFLSFLEIHFHPSNLLFSQSNTRLFQQLFVSFLLRPFFDTNAMDFAPVPLRLPPLCIHSSLSAFQVDSFLRMLLCEVLDTDLIALDLLLNHSCLLSLSEILFDFVI